MIHRPPVQYVHCHISPRHLIDKEADHADHWAA